LSFVRVFDVENFFWGYFAIKYLFCLSCGDLIWLGSCKILAQKTLAAKYCGIRG